MPGSVLAEVQRAFGEAGIDLTTLGFAWARVLPIVTIVPAFGLRALPASARAVIALALAVVIAPALSLAGGTHAARLLEEATHGLAIALAAAVPLWAATMAGGVIDSLRGSSERVGAPTVEGHATPLGVPLSILASALFLAGGGASRAVAAVAGPQIAGNPEVQASHDLLAGIALAVALGGPVLAASIVLEVGAALVTRAAAPAQIHALVAPLRAFAVLAVLAIGIDRIAEALALAMK